jgi:hypothetical protein
MENSSAEKPPEEEERGNIKKHAQGALDRIRKISAAARDKFSNLGWNGRLLVSIVAGIFVALLLFWIVDKIFYYYLVRSYVDQIASVFDLNKHLVNALILLTFIAAVFFGNLIWSFSKQKRMIGIAGIATLLVAHSLVLYFGTRDKFFDRSGAAIKCYVVTSGGVGAAF